MNELDTYRLCQLWLRWLLPSLVHVRLLRLQAVARSVLNHSISMQLLGVEFATEPERLLLMIPPMARLVFRERSPCWPTSTRVFLFLRSLAPVLLPLPVRLIAVAHFVTVFFLFKKSTFSLETNFSKCHLHLVEIHSPNIVHGFVEYSSEILIRNTLGF